MKNRSKKHSSVEFFVVQPVQTVSPSRRVDQSTASETAQALRTLWASQTQTGHETWAFVVYCIYLHMQYVCTIYYIEVVSGGQVKNLFHRLVIHRELGHGVNDSYDLIGFDWNMFCGPYTERPHLSNFFILVRLPLISTYKNG